MIRVHVTLVGIPAQGMASEAVEPVAQGTRRPMMVELPDGATVSRLVERVRQMGAATETIQQVLVNGAQVDHEAALHDGDAVVLVGQAAGEE